MDNVQNFDSYDISNWATPDDRPAVVYPFKNRKSERRCITFYVYTRLSPVTVIQLGVAGDGPLVKYATGTWLRGNAFA
jgi:hypothetical protein